MAKENTGGYGWGDEVDPANSGGEYPLLPEGEAFFTVEKLERTRKEFGKFGTINVAVITMMCTSATGDDKTQVEIKQQLGLHHNLDWKITQFFTAICQRKHGDSGKFVPNWAAVEGEVGRCMVKHRKFAKKTDATGEKTGIANEITEFLSPESEPENQDNLRF